MAVEGVPDVEVVLGLLRATADNVVAVAAERTLPPPQLVHHVLELLQALPADRLEQPLFLIVHPNRSQKSRKRAGKQSKIAPPPGRLS